MGWVDGGREEDTTGCFGHGEEAKKKIWKGLEIFRHLNW